MTQSNSNQPKPSDRPPGSAPEDKTIDPRDLVSRGGYEGNPREIIENPAVSPELIEPSPEDLRDDLMPKDLNSEG